MDVGCHGGGRRMIKMLVMVAQRDASEYAHAAPVFHPADHAADHGRHLSGGQQTSLTQAIKAALETISPAQTLDDSQSEPAGPTRVPAALVKDPLPE